jgi:hypothetical protein
MTQYIQTKAELLDHLKEQIAFMKQSAISYDNGFEGEGKRLAVVIRVLVHDTANSISLLTSLNKKNITFYDSASDYDPSRVVASHSGLVLKRFRFPNGGGEYVAPLDDLPPNRNENKKVDFTQWWDKKIVIRDNQKNTFTRKDLVLTIANTEGGAHVDPNLDQAYANLSRFHSLGWKFFRGDVAGDFKNNPVLSSIRQIAHEVLKTLKDEFPDLL